MSQVVRIPIADENAIPVTTVKPSSLDGKSGGIVQPAKRSTLGDISNTFNIPASRDALGSKKVKNAVPMPAKSSAPSSRSVRNSVPTKQQDDCMIVEPSSFSSRLSAAVVNVQAPVDPFSAARSRISQIDEEDRNNAQIPVEYINEIYSYLLSLEKQHSVSFNYMQTVQTDINEKMRSILIDWLVEVHLKFKLVPETLFLTVNLLDRYLSLVPVQRSKLQLVGVTAMLLASKFEEIYAPEVRDFVYICDKAYTREEILEMEGTILSKLGFNLSVPQAHLYMSRFLKFGGVKRKEAESLAYYFCELTLQDYAFLKYAPSVVASSAVYLALKHSTAPTNTWGPLMTALTTYPEQALAHCVKEMEDAAKMAAQRSLTAVYKKYGSDKYHEVSKNIVWD
mmetsp:Transcript_4850/g.7563  ORF Transcript_4850/g.7563 Transcript_4850/m.7563 type:complete len:395 (+) Transcript_4850:152-1336(+)|eukprot:CAMPEP_0184649196 /NCGR_PEP_ID=MMETSP0308-20130426/6501_1 /TAXON_ID=38269 /ORGANISM="Gloeochaete witrockiana, Strain SAG 46.84" /LENGTH=394 /DNA_ID=CAMNT_0027081719 /DNA_START=112 /DNA_END=1296 /DNA_ORIENTATION=-